MVTSTCLLADMTQWQENNLVYYHFLGILLKLKVNSLFLEKYGQGIFHTVYALGQ